MVPIHGPKPGASPRLVSKRAFSALSLRRIAVPRAAGPPHSSLARSARLRMPEWFGGLKARFIAGTKTAGACTPPSTASWTTCARSWRYERREARRPHDLAPFPGTVLPDGVEGAGDPGRNSSGVQAPHPGEDSAKRKGERRERGSRERDLRRSASRDFESAREMTASLLS